MEGIRTEHSHPLLYSMSRDRSLNRKTKLHNRQETADKIIYSYIHLYSLFILVKVYTYDDYHVWLNLLLYFLEYRTHILLYNRCCDLNNNDDIYIIILALIAICSMLITDFWCIFYLIHLPSACFCYVSTSYFLGASVSGVWIISSKLCNNNHDTFQQITMPCKIIAAYKKGRLEKGF